MPKRTIKQILMERDGMSEDEAEDLIADARQQLNEHLSRGNNIAAHDICDEYFGLEPDYIHELTDHI